MPFFQLAGTLLGVSRLPGRRDPVAVALGIAVRLLREERGWSREALAYRCGLEPEDIGPVEGGEGSPTLALALKLAAGLEVPAADLVGTVEELMR